MAILHKEPSFFMNSSEYLFSHSNTNIQLVVSCNQLKHIAIFSIPLPFHNQAHKMARNISLCSWLNGNKNKHKDTPLA